MPTPETPTGNNNYNRNIVLLAVSAGLVKIAVQGAWQSTINGGGVLDPNVAVIRSAVNVGKVWFADGSNYTLYDPSINTVLPWVASQGILPVDAQNRKPRLIATWRGRTVLAGLPGDPQDWFMSAVGDPTNFNYFPQSQTPTQAVAGVNAPQGLVPDVVTAIVPYTDDVMFFGGQSSIWMLNGDPMAGGQIDLVSDSIGMAWGIPWCKDPYGNIYFVSNRTGVYTLIPGQQPQRVSQGIEQLLAQTRIDEVVIRCAWDDAQQGLHIYVTPFGGPVTTSHFFYESRTGAWWQDQFANVNHSPMCCLAFDGNTPADRVHLIGSWDGYVRGVQFTAPNDDGTAISSSVVMGPLLTPDLDDVMLKDLQAILGATSGQVSYAVYLGASAETALSSPAAASGTWNAGRNLLTFVRRAGHAVWLKLTSSNGWAMEQIRARVAGLGKVRRRGA